jgi:hypothetical protein
MSEAAQVAGPDVRLPEDVELTMANCLEHCEECLRICNETLHYLLMRDTTDRGELVRRLLDCADMCRISVVMLARQSPLYRDAVQVCAMAARACAEVCDQVAIADDQLAACAEICLDCADACEAAAAE